MIYTITINESTRQRATPYTVAFSWWFFPSIFFSQNWDVPSTWAYGLATFIVLPNKASLMAISVTCVPCMRCAYTVRCTCHAWPWCQWQKSWLRWNECDDRIYYNNSDRNYSNNNSKHAQIHHKFVSWMLNGRAGPGRAWGKIESPRTYLGDDGHWVIAHLLAPNMRRELSPHYYYYDAWPFLGYCNLFGERTFNGKSESAMTDGRRYRCDPHSMELLYIDRRCDLKRIQNQCDSGDRQWISLLIRINVMTKSARRICPKSIRSQWSNLRKKESQIHQAIY